MRKYRRIEDSKRQISHSQNFFKKENDVQDLVSETDISNKDTIIEIGPGTGIITNVLLRNSEKVIAVEIDKNLYDQLKINFKNVDNLILINKNFLEWKPRQDGKFKIFSNIPFNTTADIIKYIVETMNPAPISTYLITQKEAAGKYTLQKNDKNSLLSVVYYPVYDIKIIKEISRFSFKPIPNVSIVLISIKKRTGPLIELKNYLLFKDFVSFCFTSWKKNINENLCFLLSKNQIPKINKSILKKKPSQLNFDEWILIFNFFKENAEKKGFDNILYSWRKNKEKQNNLSKRYKTTTQRRYRN